MYEKNFDQNIVFGSICFQKVEMQSECFRLQRSHEDLAQITAKLARSILQKKTDSALLQINKETLLALLESFFVLAQGTEKPFPIYYRNMIQEKTALTHISSDLRISTKLACALKLALIIE